MKLFYKLNDNYNRNNIIKYDDNSFGCDGNDTYYFDYQVALISSRPFILNFDIYSKKCLSCERYIWYDKKTKNENICIDKFSKGELLIEAEYFDRELPICEYLLKDNIKIDFNRSRICIGDINSDEVIMFGDRQYASFQNNKLIGVIVDFKNGNFGDKN